MVNAVFDCSDGTGGAAPQVGSINEGCKDLAEEFRRKHGQPFTAKARVAAHGKGGKLLFQLCICLRLCLYIPFVQHVCILRLLLRSKVGEADSCHVWIVGALRDTGIIFIDLY